MVARYSAVYQKIDLNRAFMASRDRIDSPQTATYNAQAIRPFAESQSRTAAPRLWMV